jgi:hypothetical protein
MSLSSLANAATNEVLRASLLQFSRLQSCLNFADFTAKRRFRWPDNFEHQKSAQTLHIAMLEIAIRMTFCTADRN